MNADRVMKFINLRLGDPSVGPVHDVMPIIEEAVKEAFGEKPKDEASGKTEKRVVKAEETRNAE